MNFPLEQQKKAFLKKLISERQNERAVFASEANFYIQQGGMEVFAEEIRYCRKMISAINKEIKLLDGMAKRNKEDIIWQIETCRMLKRFDYLYDGEPTAYSDAFDLPHCDQ